MAYNSGQTGVTDAFQNSFWYANILGQLSKTRHMTHAVFCRQTLVGGWYDLLSHSNNLEPNPDYWLAVLWKRLMGTTSLYSERIGCCQQGTERLLVHAFCARYDSTKYNVEEGDVAIVLVNIANDTSYKAALDETSDVWDAESRLEFLIQADVDNTDTASALSARRVTINGQQMRLGANGELPEIEPFEKHDSDDGMVLPPYSVMFAVLRGAKVSLCMRESTTDQHVQEVELKAALLVADEISQNEIIDPALESQLLRSRPTSSVVDSIGSEYGFVILLVLITVGGILLALKSSSVRRQGRRRVNKRLLHYSR